MKRKNVIKSLGMLKEYDAWKKSLVFDITVGTRVKIKCDIDSFFKREYRSRMGKVVEIEGSGSTLPLYKVNFGSDWHYFYRHEFELI